MNDAGVIILCPGQGAQIVGMAQKWAEQSSAAKAVFDEADKVLGDTLGATLSELCFNGPKESLDKTNVSQPAIYTAGVASLRGVEQRDGKLNAIAAGGLSLGEYTALHIAGVFDFATGLKLVAERGRLMQDAAEKSKGGMVALTGNADEETVVKLCDEARGGGVLVPANYNSSMQVVASGSIDACERLVELAGSSGLKATPLAVAGAFHSPLMQPAADRMGEVLSSIPFQSPNIPVWSNVTGQKHEENPELLKRRLVEQVVSPVRWHQQCLDMRDNLGAVGTDAVQWIELSPQSTLRGLMKRIDRELKVTSYDEP